MPVMVLVRWSCESPEAGGDYRAVDCSLERCGAACHVRTEYLLSDSRCERMNLVELCPTKCGVFRCRIGENDSHWVVDRIPKQGLWREAVECDHVCWQTNN